MGRMAIWLVIIAFLLAIVDCQAFVSNRDGRSSLHRLTRINGADTFAFRSTVLHRNKYNPNLHVFPASSSALQMGLFDFLNTREGDFIPLQNNEDTYGPGPLIIMYAIPNSIEDDELRDMVEDGTNSKDVVIRRVGGVVLDEGGGEDSDGNFLDLTVRDALNTAMKDGNTLKQSTDVGNAPIVVSQEQYSSNDPCPVLYFSGISNTQMMDTYRIIANEIYQETNGVHWPACAKVVEPAMGKTLRQVLMEISGDHADAMRLRKEGNEGTEK